MAQFRYIAKSRAGERQEGVLDAPDKRTVMRTLSQHGLVPISVTEGSGASAAPTMSDKPAKRGRKKTTPTPAIPMPKKRVHKNWFRFERGHRAHPRMKLGDMLLVTSELSDLLASGMTLGSALHALAQRSTGKPHDAIVVDLRDEIVSGTSLSAALSRWPESFPTLYVSMVKAGEASGQLPSVLERLVMHYERMQAAREKVGMALVYPLIVTLVGFGAMIFMMIFVVPRFSAMFEELGGTLPLPTRILIGLSKGLLQYGWALLIGLFLLAIAIRRALKTPAGIEWKDRMLLRLPAVGGIVRANAFANFAHTLGTLLANGVQVLQALAIVEHTVGNSIIARAVHSAKERVTDGSTISRPLSQDGVFPRLLTDMLSVGEESGDMVSALEHIGRRYDNELDRSVKLFTTILEPLMMVLIAVGVGFMAISMLLAVFELTSGLNA
ncbi:MAG: type II secretion system F family protein [Kiritimatiellia bacterium]|jgi:type II secretory pathway component PulF|nr:type II secretion system F family protein [Kiritimatiellia bacterium]